MTERWTHARQSVGSVCFCILLLPKQRQGSESRTQQEWSRPRGADHAQHAQVLVAAGSIAPSKTGLSRKRQQQQLEAYCGCTSATPGGEHGGGHLLVATTAEVAMVGQLLKLQ